MPRRSRPILLAGIASMSALLLPAGRVACAQQATVTNTRGLDFGRIVAVGAGTVVVTPGVPGAKGYGVIVLNGGSPGPATFTVSGNAGKKLAYITFPSPSIQLTSVVKGVTSTMTVDTFQSSPAAGIGTPPAKAANVSVGATLHVKSPQAAGTYSGSFSLTVNYN
jgi:hypothetical protein